MNKVFELIFLLAGHLTLDEMVITIKKLSWEHTADFFGRGLCVSWVSLGVSKNLFSEVDK
jgi:hypothetical protein